MFLTYISISMDDGECVSIYDPTEVDANRGIRIISCEHDELINNGFQMIKKYKRKNIMIIFCIGIMLASLIQTAKRKETP